MQQKGNRLKIPFIKSDIREFTENCQPTQVLLKTGHITYWPTSALRTSEAQLTKHVLKLKLFQRPLWIKMEHICYATYTCSASLTIIEIIKFLAKIIQLLSYWLTFHAMATCSTSWRGLTLWKLRLMSIIHISWLPTRGTIKFVSHINISWIFLLMEMAGN